jgi:YesN/AraC family two-component response regulator
MFKVMLVEDEPPIMRMIKSVIENSSPDFVVTKCCINGKAAVEALTEEDFDVVITDIKMPIMSGVELAGWIYHNKPETTVVIVSGYQDFEYARKALEYKVFDYLLKPISKEKVKELTDRIKKEFGGKAHFEHSDDRNTVIILACAGAYLLYGSEVLLPGERFWTDEVIENFMNENLEKSEGYIFFNTNMQSERFVVLESECVARQEELVNRLYNKLIGRELPITIVYKKGVKFKDAGKTFSVLRDQLIKRLILDKSQIICCDEVSETYENIGEPYSKHDIEIITAAIKNGNAEEVSKKIKEVFSTMREADCTQEEINNFLNIILDTYTLNYPKKIQRKNTSVKHEFVNAIAGFVSYEDFTEDIVSILMTLKSDTNQTDRYAQLADNIEEYLIKNYNKNITNDTLAKEFGFVPSYISRLFKRQKGVSPNEYLIQYRIELAKKLILENSDMRIKEIAEMVGFKESYYFSKTFKRKTGVWPTEFGKQSG